MRGPNGKHIFGTVKVGERGQISIPKEARVVFGIRPGDELMLVGDESTGLAIITASQLASFFTGILEREEGAK